MILIKLGVRKMDAGLYSLRSDLGLQLDGKGRVECLLSNF
jgi:hypothetical protein